jgi:hypothetical protein
VLYLWDSGEFLLCRHNNLLEGLRRCALVYNSPKRRSPRVKDLVRRFFYAFVGPYVS